MLQRIFLVAVVMVLVDIAWEDVTMDLDIGRKGEPYSDLW